MGVIMKQLKHLTHRQMWIFAIGQLGWSLLGGIINAWLVTFYLPTEEGIVKLVPPGLIVFGVFTVLGIITFGCRIFDAITDPLIASLSDRSTNKNGRRIPFMKKAAIPFAVVTVLVFMAPVNAMSGTNVAWLSVMLVLFYLFMTMYCTPYNALISEFAKNQEERMYISTSISLTYFFGTMLAYTPFVFAGMLRGAAGYYNSYRICFVVLAIIALVCMLLPTFYLKERDFVDSKPDKTNTFKSLTSTFRNKGFRIFVGSDIMYWVGLTLFQTGLPFFVKVSMKLDEFYTMVFLGAMTVLSACFYPVVGKLVKKFGKKKLTICGFLGLALAYTVTALIGILPLPGIVFGVIIVLVSAFPMALLGIIPQAIVADVAEEESVVTGENRQGMFFAARTFSMKFGQSVAMLAFTSLAILGVNVDVTSNDITASAFGLRIVAIVAVVFCVAGALILSLYNEKSVLKHIAKAEDSAYVEAVK